jgi:drug/metabolite transporter (DMT)-like permease
MDRKPYIALFVSIVSVSFAAILIKLSSMDEYPLTIAFYRLLFTTILILPFVVFFKKTRYEIKKLPRKTFLIMIGIGVILAAHFAFWITSLSFTSVASSVILVTAHPILVGPVSHFFFKEKLSIINSVGIIISVTGVIILVTGNIQPGVETIDTLEGNILAILGGIMAGLYILGGRKIRKTVSVTSYAFIVYSISAIVLLFLCIVFNSRLVNISLTDFEIFIAMAIVAGLCGHTLYNWSLKHVRASVASVALLGEPLGSTLWAILIPSIAQIPSNYTIFGGGIILLGIYLTARKAKTLI